MKDEANDAAASVKRLRKALKLTQQELGDLLGVSRKSIESYEQGWRNVPDRILRDIISILAAQAGPDMTSGPCWERTGRKRMQCEGCFAYQRTGGRNCWLIHSAGCKKPKEAGTPSALQCMQCPVVQFFLHASES